MVILKELAMFSKELKNLIDAAFVDGVLTDKERTIILNKAKMEGENIDEVELFLDAEVQKRAMAKKKASKEERNANLSVVLGILLLLGILVFCFFMFEYLWNILSI